MQLEDLWHVGNTDGRGRVSCVLRRSAVTFVAISVEGFAVEPEGGTGRVVEAQIKVQQRI